MLFKNLQMLWLPFLVALFGTALSFFAWYFLSSQEGQSAFAAATLELYHPLIILALGASISVLVATILWITQMARQHALQLQKINEDLKREIIERTTAEKMQRKLEVALLQGQKLQAMGTLAGGIAHDFNNILYAIIGYIEMAKEDLPQNELVQQNLDKVLSASRRGQELVGRILAFSRRQQHQQHETIDLKQTIETALELLRPTIPAGTIIHLEPTIEAKILGDQTQLHQVLVNIINNAVDAMDEEGTVDIHMSRVPLGDPYLSQFPNVLPQNYCKIEIVDTGHGMDQATIERIFEPFFTTKEVGKGTGLGLSIVHSIIKEHHGEITVKSQLGNGTIFTLLLPEHSPQ